MTAPEETTQGAAPEEDFIAIDPDSSKGTNPYPVDTWIDGKLATLEVHTSKAGGQSLHWEVSGIDPSTGVARSVHSYNSLKKYTRSKNDEWLRNLGVTNPAAGFDRRTLLGMDVKFQVALEPDNRDPKVMRDRLVNIIKA